MISVIIPVYNTEKYLKRCIDSVLDSTYQDFELILVNDGSEDNSLEVCRNYCGKDRRIRLIDQEHTGVSEARNRAVRESRGEWIVFVDSDDFISNDFFQMIMQEKFQSFDLLIFDFLRKKKRVEYAPDSRTSVWHAYTCCYKKEEKTKLIRHLLNGTQLSETGNMSLLSPWAKAYKRNVLEQYTIRFQSELVIGEDSIFNLEYIMAVRSCIYIQKSVYYVELRPNSAIHGFNPFFLKNDLQYQKQLKNILIMGGFWGRLERDYYNRVLSCMADVLIRGIYHPESNRTWRENRMLCEDMRRFRIYRQALKYNGKTGVIPRRMLLFCYRMRYDGIAMLIAKGSYWILEKMEEL